MAAATATLAASKAAEPTRQLRYSHGGVLASSVQRRSPEGGSEIVGSLNTQHKHAVLTGGGNPTLRLGPGAEAPGAVRAETWRAVGAEALGSYIAPSLDHRKGVGLPDLQQSLSSSPQAADSALLPASSAAKEERFIVGDPAINPPSRSNDLIHQSETLLSVPAQASSSAQAPAPASSTSLASAGSTTAAVSPDPIISSLEPQKLNGLPPTPPSPVTAATAAIINRAEATTDPVAVLSKVCGSISRVHGSTKYPRWVSNA